METKEKNEQLGEKGNDGGEREEMYTRTGGKKKQKNKKNKKTKNKKQNELYYTTRAKQRTPVITKQEQRQPST